MPDKNNEISRINNPIQVALKMIEATQESVFNSIIGPMPAARSIGKINGQEVDPILDQIVQNAQMMGMMQQEQQGVSAPPAPTETPTPMPTPPPPTSPEGYSAGGAGQMPMGVPQSDMDELSKIFGGGMNNGI
jgi:hypothetical protein